MFIAHGQYAGTLHHHDLALSAHAHCSNTAWYNVIGKGRHHHRDTDVGAGTALTECSVHYYRTASLNADSI